MTRSRVLSSAPPMAISIPGWVTCGAGRMSMTIPSYGKEDARFLSPPGMHRASARALIRYRCLRLQLKWREEREHGFFRWRRQDALLGELLRLRVCRCPNAFRRFAEIVERAVKLDFGPEQEPIGAWLPRSEER